MSVAEVDETVSSSGIWRATSFCISAKPYHRRTSGLRHHRAAATSRTRSRVIGWCTVATTGRPSSAIFSRPVPRHWLSCTTSKSSRRSASIRAARRLNVFGSGKPAVQVVSSSSRSMRVLISLGHGMRNGSGSRYRSRLGTLVSRTRGSRHLGIGLAGEHLDVVAEFDEAAGQVADVDPLPAAMGLAPVGQQSDAHSQLTTMRIGWTDPGPVSWTNRVTQKLRTLWTCVQTIV